MTTHLATFADSQMSRSAQLCVESAKQHGVNHTISYSRDVLETTAFYDENKSLLDQPRGSGYFAWKPYVIKALMGVPADLGDPYVTPPQEGDILIYADAGVEFINNVNYIIDRMDQDIFLFGNMYEHAHWCKRDVIEDIWPGWTEFRPGDLLHNPNQGWQFFGKQVQASVIFFRVSDYTRQFVKEWLDWCLFEGGRLIDDSPSRTPNHPEFQENRHDQAILTTLAYREGLRLHYWPAQYNDGAFEYPRGDYPDEGYPILFHHHRRRNHEWEQVA